MKKFNSYNYKNIYEELGLDLAELGCIMADLDNSTIPAFNNANLLYYTKDKKKFWIDGFVAEKTPHATLLYGLLKSGKEWEGYVNQVLQGWELKTVKVKDVSYFESPYEDEPYYCIVAHLALTPKLLEGHYRLSLLPHINTFPAYKAHFTLAYIKKDELKRNAIINFYNEHLAGKELKVTGINLGGKG